MSMTDDGVFYDDTGEPVGHLLQAEDGAQILLAFDGETVLAAATPDGQQLDPAAYAIDTGSDDEPVSRAEFDAYQQALAEQQHQQMLAAQYQQPPEQNPTPWQELAHQKTDIEKQLGRTLTMAEATAAARNVQRQLDQGFPVDMQSALEVGWASGDAKPIDMDSGPDRREWMAERLHLNERAEQGENLGEPPAPSQDLYNLEDGTGRRQWMADRVEGRLDDDTANAVAYNGSDYAE